MEPNTLKKYYVYTIAGATAVGAIVGCYNTPPNGRGHLKRRTLQTVQGALVGAANAATLGLPFVMWLWDNYIGWGFTKEPIPHATQHDGHFVRNPDTAQLGA